MRFTHRLLIAALLTILVTPSFCEAQAPAKPTLASIYALMGAERWQEAKRDADLFMPSATPDDRLNCSLSYGRILISLKLTDAAQGYLKLMEQSVGNDHAALLEVYRAALETHTNPDSGIEKLEAILKQNERTWVTAEAADFLASAYLAYPRQSRTEDAQKAVDFGLALLAYAHISSDYTGQLLKGRMASGASAAEKLLVEARRLQSEKKFAEAGELYQRVIAEYPTSEHVHQAGHRVAECLLALGRGPEAYKYWLQFLEHPDLPWRGQARVAIIDLALEKNLDLKMASEHALAATAALAKVAGTVPVPSPADAKQSPDTSWQDAAFDIHLRQGIVSLVDGRYDAAAAAFKEAQSTLATQAAKSAAAKPDNEPLVRGLERLTKAAHDRAPVLPKELAGGEARTVTALALGNIYCVINDYPTAQKFFQQILSGNNRSSSGPHRSFASFGLARTRANLPRAGESQLVRFEEAKALCQQSWNEYKPGSWHDETLFRAATLIEDLASARFTAKKADVGAKDTKRPAKNLTAKEREAQAKAEKARSNALLKAKREALSYWQKIVAQFPKSPRCEQALYHVGIVEYETAAVAASPDSGPKWKEAAATFGRLCEIYPKSSFAGDAYVRQIDIALEKLFDPARALTLIDEGVRWAKDQGINVTTTAEGKATPEAMADAQQVIADADAALPAWGQMGIRRGSALLDDLYNLHLRAGVMAYLDGEYDKAAQHFESAGPARLTDGMQGRFVHEKVGLHILMECCDHKTPAWSADATKAAETDNQKLALKLADTYLHGQRSDKAIAIYQWILADISSHGKSNKEIESYCLMKLAGAGRPEERDYARSVESYKQFYQKDYANLPWTPIAIMRLGVLEYNTTHDPRRAIPHYKYVLANYPDHEVAERALYFLATLGAEVGDVALAEASCQQFIERYPQSGWRNHVQTILKSDLPKLRQKGQKQ